MIWYGALAVLVLILFDKFPGTRYLVQPIVAWILKGAEAIVGGGWAWIVWVVKGIWRSHVTLFKHLVYPREVMDPVAHVRGKRLGPEDES